MLAPTSAATDRLEGAVSARSGGQASSVCPRARVRETVHRSSSVSGCEARPTATGRSRKSERAVCDRRLRNEHVHLTGVARAPIAAPANDSAVRAARCAISPSREAAHQQRHLARPPRRVELASERASRIRAWEARGAAGCRPPTSDVRASVLSGMSAVANSVIGGCGRYALGRAARAKRIRTYARRPRADIRRWREGAICASSESFIGRGARARCRSRDAAPRSVGLFFSVHGDASGSAGDEEEREERFAERA